MVAVAINLSSSRILFALVFSKVCQYFGSAARNSCFHDFTRRECIVSRYRYCLREIKKASVQQESQQWLKCIPIQNKLTWAVFIIVYHTQMVIEAAERNWITCAELCRARLCDHRDVCAARVCVCACFSAYESVRARWTTAPHWLAFRQRRRRIVQKGNV